MKIVQRQLKQKIKQTIQKKNKIDEGSPEEFIKNNKYQKRNQIQIQKLELDLEVKSITFFIEKIKKIALRLIDDKRIQSIESIETYAYGMNKNLFLKKRN